MPLKILSYDELYGWTMDRVVSTIGKKNNCTFCGVFRRQALDRGAASLAVDHIVTGHNADDIAETVLMNSTCSFTITPSQLTDTLQSCGAISRGSGGAPRSAHRAKTRYGGQNHSNTPTRRRSSCTRPTYLFHIHISYSVSSCIL